MTVIAFDGKILAADRQATLGDRRVTVSKIFKIRKAIVACSGALPYCLSLVDWYRGGADQKEFPEYKGEDEWGCLVVYDKGIKYYESRPFPIILQDPFAAWGSGGSYAMGAMAMGADARRAVEVAIRFDTGCGNGVEWFEV